MTKKLFIIGNGFDLHHGIASKYSEFATYLKDEDRTVFDIAEEYVVPEKDLWSCLEERLAEVDVDQIEECANNFLVSYGADDWSDSYHHDYEYEIEQICAAISEKLRSHFSDWVRKIVIPSYAGNPVRCIEPASLFLNFNYTSTLQRLYDVPDSRILHIHGSVQDPTAEIILGHGWYRQTSDLRSRFTDEDTDVRVAGGFTLIDDLLANTFKPTKEIITRNKMFFHSLHSVSQIYVLGHSLADVDAPYFNEVLSNVSSNAQWIVSFYSDGAEILSAARNMGIPASNIQVELITNL
ncbi:bacteriophage abortive infection AbiH family protein [Litoreibacter albidus]|uniref:bacteriophage abortive infection AbiH family protein n=1 Tax=Litoreibacter albidus TaxID=670155 RepID=UPI0037353FBE